ncbi:hypothetical protein ABPG72_021385 [Tetrahymena utriculariae]
MNSTESNPTFIPKKTDSMLAWEWASDCIQNELANERKVYDAKNTQCTTEDQFREMLNSLGLGYCFDGQCVYASAVNSETKGLIAVRFELRNKYEQFHLSVKSNSTNDVEYLFQQILQKLN